MKKTAFVTILSATLLFTSCSSGQTPAISALTEATEATTATTTEATTTTTMEETTTTVETAAEPEKPEDYAQLYFMNEGNLREIHATDFEFVDAELYKDPNGVLRSSPPQSGHLTPSSFSRWMPSKSNTIAFLPSSLSFNLSRAENF